ncbi:fimbrial protein [Escherichia coli]|uniref:F4 family fimbrial subunit n=1 Tax=Escherichia coli TaxID=562 RepID=UPI00136AD78E|nr:fimbrial protein [Escherichia coli]MXF23827.1 fimbrial protein [Escherichia coli]
MKKTLIALAVAASAAVSGSAMAWTASGPGGSVDLGGTLNPADVITPWEVKVGAAVNGLDADIRKGDTEVDIPVKKAIPVLGIRVADATWKAFMGQPGITPNIDYHGAINVNDFSRGEVPLTLDVKNTQDQKIGSLTVNLSAGAEYARYNPNTDRGEKYMLYQKSASELFFGGLGTNIDAISPDAWWLANNLNPEFVANYNDFGVTQMSNPYYGDVIYTDLQYSAFYASGVEQGKTIKLTLEQPAASDAIAWKASLPVTVSYQ